MQHFAGHGDALFEDQLGIVGSTGQFSDGGDSGSIVVNNYREAIGMVFASALGLDISFANLIDPVFNYFGVTPL